MAIDTVVNVTDTTMLVKQMDDRLAANPWTEGHFARVRDAGVDHPVFGDTFELHPEGWRYTIRISDPALLVERQKFALKVIVEAALTEAGSAANPDTIVDAIFAAGITFDHARTSAWEDLETKRRAGTALAGEIELVVAEGRQRLTDAGFL